jgi:hypothetical protein
MLAMSTVVATGIYYGYARVLLRDDGGDTGVYPMVMSLGWNPFFHNERLTAVRRSPYGSQDPRFSQDNLPGNSCHAHV